MTPISTFTSLGLWMGSFLMRFDGFFEELAVHFVADGGDVAGLLGAEHVAGAADFEVAHGDLEAGAELADIPRWP